MIYFPHANPPSFLQNIGGHVLRRIARANMSETKSLPNGPTGEATIVRSNFPSLEIGFVSLMPSPVDIGIGNALRCFWSHPYQDLRPP